MRSNLRFKRHFFQLEIALTMAWKRSGVRAPYSPPLFGPGPVFRLSTIKCPEVTILAQWVLVRFISRRIPLDKRARLALTSPHQHLVRSHRDSGPTVRGASHTYRCSKRKFRIELDFKSRRRRRFQSACDCIRRRQRMYLCGCARARLPEIYFGILSRQVLQTEHLEQAPRTLSFQSSAIGSLGLTPSFLLTAT